MHFDQLRERRKRLGMSQSAVATAAGISLLTLQNIEAGRGNPSLGILEALFAALGLSLELKVREPDWSRLVSLGLPITMTDRKKSAADGVRSSKELPAQLTKAALVIGDAPGIHPERLIEAFQSLLLALKLHFPTYYRTNLQGIASIEALFPHKISGRLVKLQRQALPVLCEYL